MSHEKDIEAALKLDLNIKYPDLEDCYRFGYEAFGKALDLSENPFEKNTKEHAYWSDGWMDNALGEKPTFPILEAQTQKNKSSHSQGFFKPVDVQEDAAPQQAPKLT